MLVGQEQTGRGKIQDADERWLTSSPVQLERRRPEKLQHKYYQHQRRGCEIDFLPGEASFEQGIP